MLISELTTALEELAPVQLQESYDNSGLLVGKPEKEISKVLISVDVTEQVLEEAFQKKCDLIVSHHPLIFGGLKKITGKSSTERIVIEAIKKDIAIYAIHTNLDNVNTGVNKILCDKLGIQNVTILSPKEKQLYKLVTFCPVEKAEKIRKSLFEAGAGHIGNYDSCSFNLDGTGSFRGSDTTDPYVGKKGKLHYEKEVRIETVFPAFKQNKVIQNLLNSHPYEEVAYDIYPLENLLPTVGAGMLGELPVAISEEDFLHHIKNVTGIPCIRHSELTGRLVKKVAVCGGSGSFLIKNAIQHNADIFITGDLKYHDFFLAEKKLVLADIGHYESEQFVKELIYSDLIKKFSNFAVLISEANTNSVNYL